MSDMIAPELLRGVFFAVFRETVENSGDIYLDKNTSLFETLETITAEEASIPVSASCASLAAQVEHVRFYMENTERAMQGEDVEDADFTVIWRTVRAVTPEQWDESRVKLRATYERISQKLRATEVWNNENAIGGPLTILVHTAFHLGQIRQSLCTLKQR